MIRKALLALVLLIALTEAKQCQTIENTRCSQDSQCDCKDAKLICNWVGLCARESFMDKKFRSKPCYHTVFKRACSTDADCLCKEDTLVCEQNECIQPRRNMLA